MWMLRLRLLHSANNSELRVSIKPSYAGYNVNYIAWGGIYMLLGKKFFVIFLLSIYFIYFLSFNILACEISGFIKGIDNINNRLKIDGYWYNINKGTKIYRNGAISTLLACRLISSGHYQYVHAIIRDDFYIEKMNVEYKIREGIILDVYHKDKKLLLKIFNGPESLSDIEILSYSLFSNKEKEFKKSRHIVVVTAFKEIIDYKTD